MLWSDTIDNLSSYSVEGASFHTMRYSFDHTMQVGFSFDTKNAADEMWSHIEKLVACPENISLSTPGSLVYYATRQVVTGLFQVKRRKKLRRKNHHRCLRKATFPSLAVFNT